MSFETDAQRVYEESLRLVQITSTTGGYTDAYANARKTWPDKIAEMDDVVGGIIVRNDFATLSSAVSINPIWIGKIGWAISDETNVGKRTEYPIIDNGSGVATLDSPNRVTLDSLVAAEDQVYRGDSIGPKLDTTRRQIRIPKLRDAIANMSINGTGRSSIMVFGDSIGQNLFPGNVYGSLWREYGFRGMWNTLDNWAGGPRWDLNSSPGVPSGTVEVNTNYFYNPTGLSFSLNSAGNVVAFNSEIATGEKYKINRATIVYGEQVGGGVFKVQYLPKGGYAYNNDNWIDVVGMEAVDSNAVSPGNKTLVVDLPALEDSQQVRVAWASGGEVIVIGVLMEDTTATGLVIAPFAKGGLNLFGQANTVDPASLGVLLSVISPDLVLWQFKDSIPNEYVEDMQTLWDTQYKTDWLFITEYPDQGASETTMLERSASIISHAITNGHDYFDSMLYFPTYQYGFDRGWYADSTHLNALGVRILSSYFWPSAGLLARERLDANWSSPRIEKEIRADTISIGGRDQGIANAKAYTSHLEKSGVKVTASTPGYVSNKNGSPMSAIGLGAFTVGVFFKVPYNIITTEHFGLRQATSGGNSPLSIAVSVMSATVIRVSIRNSDNTASTNFDYTVDLAQHSGNIVMLMVRRDILKQYPLTLWLGDSEFYSVQPQSSQLAEISGQYFKVGAGSAAIGAQDNEYYGAALYDYALSDEQITDIAHSGHFVDGAKIHWPMLESNGHATRDISGNSIHGVFSANVSWREFNSISPVPYVQENSSYNLNSGPIINGRSSGSANYVLPSNPDLGREIDVIGYGAIPWRITQPEGHQIVTGAGNVIGTNATTVGSLGYIQSASRYDSIKLRCIYADSVLPSYIWSISSMSASLTWV